MFKILFMVLCLISMRNTHTERVKWKTKGALNSTHAASLPTFHRCHIISFHFLSREKVIASHTRTLSHVHGSPAVCHFPDPAWSKLLLETFTESCCCWRDTGGGGEGGVESSVSLQRLCSLVTAGSELQDVGREGAAAVVPAPVWGLPGCEHHQHDHVVQRRTGFLRPHPQTQTRSHVSRETRSGWSFVVVSLKT